jgi:hypothetical protein
MPETGRQMPQTAHGTTRRSLVFMAAFEQGTKALTGIPKLSGAADGSRVDPTSGHESLRGAISAARPSPITVESPAAIVSD